MSANPQRPRSFSLAAPGRRPSQKTQETEQGLTVTQVEAFREVFGLFDVNGGGTIDANELHSALCSVDIHLSKDEIEDVLCVMDEDGNGEVDFEEFLALMTSTEKYLEALACSEKEQKESLLFSALTKFMTKSALSSISEIERYYNAKVRKSPHVVGHYAAGARLIGLTEKQMAQHLATLNHSSDENSDSPYAQPVSLFSSPNKLIKPRRNHKIKLRIVNRKFKEDQNSKLDEECSTDLSKIDVPLIDTPVSATLTSIECRNKRPTSCISSSLYLRPQNSVKLPAISMKIVQKNPDQLTIEDLPTIRSQVEMAYRRFYIQQKKTSNHPVNAFADISHVPKRLQLPFLTILTAYNVKPVNIPPKLRLRLAQQQPWQQEQHLDLD